jgi:hypothetical protein
VSVDVLAALAPMARAFTFLGVRYYVGGSLASAVRGVPRSGLDVDVAAELMPPHVAPLVAALAREFYVSGDRVREAVESRRSFHAVHLASMMKVDVFVSRQRPFERALFDRLKPEFLDVNGTSVPYPVPRAEDVVLLKLDWFRAGGESSPRQWGDVIGVLKVSEADIDHAYLARWAGDLGLADLVERARAEAAA